MSEINNALSAFDRGYVIGCAMYALAASARSPWHPQGCPGDFAFVGEPCIETHGNHFRVAAVARCQACGHEETFSVYPPKCPDHLCGNDVLSAASIQKLQVQPGDVLILEESEEYQVKEVDLFRFNEIIKAHLGTDNFQIIVVPLGCKLTKRSNDDPCALPPTPGELRGAAEVCQKRVDPLSEYVGFLLCWAADEIESLRVDHSLNRLMQVASPSVPGATGCQMYFGDSKEPAVIIGGDSNVAAIQEAVQSDNADAAPSEPPAEEPKLPRGGWF